MEWVACGLYGWIRLGPSIWKVLFFSKKKKFGLLQKWNKSKRKHSPTCVMEKAEKVKSKSANKSAEKETPSSQSPSLPPSNSRFFAYKNKHTATQINFTIFNSLFL